MITNKKPTGIALLKKNFSVVEEKFPDFFEKGEPRWPTEKHDYLRNHHQSLDHFFADSISLAKLKLTGLPDNILREIEVAFEAFKKGEEYA